MDWTASSSSSSSSLLLVVLAACSCVAESLNIVYNVTEHAAPDTRIGNLTQDIFRSLRLNAGPQLNFVLLQCDDKLAINGYGELLVVDDIDREKVAMLSCAVAVNRLQGSADGKQWPSIPNQISLQIVVLDVNDQVPRWEGGDQLTIELAENEAVKTARSIPFAVDTDATASKLTYSKTRTTLSNGTRVANDPFNLVQTRDGLLISLVGRLDYESVGEYRFFIVASDAAHNATLEVLVRVKDVNEFAPQFANSSYVVHVAEDLSPYSGVPFATIGASDLDGSDRDRLRYSIVPGSQLFEIDDDGNLKLLRELDFEQTRQHTFTVVAKDHGLLSSSASVTVSVLDVNDVAPRIIGTCKSGLCQALDVAENEPPGVTDFKVHVSDEDSGRFGDVTCTLSPDTDWDKFSLRQDGVSKVYLLETRSSLDREQTARYIVTIVCEDDGGAEKKSSDLRVSVNVLDRNDCAPQLSAVLPQAASSVQVLVRDGVPLVEVSENTNVHSVVATLRAEDRDEAGGPNARVNFRLVQQSPSENGSVFQLLPDGTLLLARALDRELASDYEIKLLLTDQGSPSLNSTATIRVRVLDVVDTAPHFANRSYHFALPENVPIGFEVAALNLTDPDDEALNNVKVEVTNWPAQRTTNQSCMARMHFSVDSLGVLRTISPIDRESCPQFIFQVLAVDSAGFSDTANVVLTVLDVNDHRPVFVFPSPNNNSVRVRLYRENMPIAYVSAVDADENHNCELTYALKTSSKSELFAIDQHRGDLRLRRRPQSTDIGQYRLIVEASDCGHVRHNTSQTLIVIIDKEALEGGAADDQLTTAFFETNHKSNQSASAYIQDNYVLMVCLVSVFGCMIVLALIALVVLCKRFASPRADSAKSRRRANRKRQGRGVARANDSNNNEHATKIMLAAPSSMCTSASFSRAPKPVLPLCERESVDNDRNFVVCCEACKLAECETMDVHEQEHEHEHDKKLLQVAPQAIDMLSPCSYQTDTARSISDVSDDNDESRPAQTSPERCTLVHCTITAQTQESQPQSLSQTRTAPATDSLKKRQLVQTITRRPPNSSAGCSCTECSLTNDVYARVPLAPATDLWLSPSQSMNVHKQVLDAEMMSFVPRLHKKNHNLRTLPRSSKTNLAITHEQSISRESKGQPRSSSVADQPQSQTRLKSFAKPLDSASYV